MSRTLFLVLLAVASLLPGSAVAAPPNNGYIGVFGDAAGTNCCITMNSSGNGRFYLYLVTAGATAAGFTGAEFRVSIEPSASGVGFVWNPAGGVVLNSGDPIDNGSGGGLFMSFSSCQTVTGLAGDKIPLGTIHVMAMTTQHEAKVRMHSTPSNPRFSCPSVTLCDAAAFTQVCLTLEQGDPALGGDEPVAFTSAVNSTSCSGTSCGFVAVAPSTWSQVKSLFQ